MKIPSDTTKLERKTVERNRRIHMKGLCFKLDSLIPRQHSKAVMLTQKDQFDLAASYVTQLKERVENLKSRKEQAMKFLKENNNNDNNFENIGMRLPIIELKDLGNSIEVILVSGLNKKFMLSQVIRILEEEGGEVVSASSSIVDEDKVFHTIHAQVKIPRVGIETTRVWQRLQHLIT